MRFFSTELFLSSKFFITLNGIVGIWVALYLFRYPDVFGIMVTLLFIGICCFEYIILFLPQTVIKTGRIIPGKLSNGDINVIQIFAENLFQYKLAVRIVDEIPHQFQKRDFSILFRLEPREIKSITYELIPRERGEYHFGRTHFFLSFAFGFLQRRISVHEEQTVPVYPSFIHLQRFELMALQDKPAVSGMRKIRKIGHSMEFEQIKDYVLGDDIRTINWKATSRRGKLMVNHYSDEISQPIYSVIDSGRLMKMPFKGMRLLDYAVNATLMISDVAIKKEDRAGLAVIKENASTIIPAEKGTRQIKALMENLYNLSTDYAESDFESFSASFISRVRQRSLVILFTNFETENSLERNISAIAQLAQYHLTVVVFFKNTEISDMLAEGVKSEDDVYLKLTIISYMQEKRKMMKLLENKGIHTILTAPSELNINVFNKYIELKRRGLI